MTKSTKLTLKILGGIVLAVLIICGGLLVYLNRSSGKTGYSSKLNSVKAEAQKLVYDYIDDSSVVETETESHCPLTFFEDIGSNTGRKAELELEVSFDTQDEARSFYYVLKNNLKDNSYKFKDARGVNDIYDINNKSNGLKATLKIYEREDQTSLVVLYLSGSACYSD